MSNILTPIKPLVVVDSLFLMEISKKGLDKIILEEIGDEEIDVFGVEEEDGDEEIDVVGVEEEESSKSQGGVTLSELKLADTVTVQIPSSTSDRPQESSSGQKRKHCSFLDTPRKKQTFRKGRPIRSQASMCIINALNYCEREKDLVNEVLSKSYSPVFDKKAFQSKLNECSLDPVRQVQERTASILGISRSTLQKVVKRAEEDQSIETPRKSKGKRKRFSKIDGFVADKIRLIIHR